MKNIRNISTIFTDLVIVVSLLYSFYSGFYPLIKKMLNNKEGLTLVRDPLTPGTIPDNGLCSRAEMCETLYNKKTIRKSVVKPPTLDGGVRVNYFNSEVSLPI